MEVFSARSKHDLFSVTEMESGWHTIPDIFGSSFTRHYVCVFSLLAGFFFAPAPQTIRRLIGQRSSYLLPNT